MSELQLGLIVVGAVVLVAVVAFNKWQERKVAKSVTARFGTGRHDVLMEGEARREPHLSGVGRGTQGESESPPLRTTPPAAGPSAAASTEPEAEPDAELETVVEVSFAQPVAGEALMPYLHNLRHAGRKSIRLFAALSSGGTVTSVRPKDAYTGLRFGVLLANRSGPLSAIEYSEVVTKVQSLADAFDGVTDFPEMDAVVRQAADLDARSSALDALVGLTLSARGQSWDGELIGDAAARNDLVLLPDGRYHRVDEAGETLFVLAHPRGLPFEPGQMNALKMEQVALLLDVPQFREQATPFSDMAAVGQALADVLNAELLDDGGKPVAPAASPAIDARIQALYGQLREAGLPAGSARARRLFS